MSRPSTVRKIAFLTTLALVVALWGLVRLQQRNLEVDAAPFVEKAVQENVESGLDVVSRLSVSRDALFFGTPRAKVEVFVRDTDQPPSAGIRGIEYHYAFENGEWLFKDSGSCTSEECTIRGREAFQQH
ncbi:MAG: hypothetical protein HYV26_00900 [Candidatus Hydrogenedentes bacterium]|nr:hypothetical protein [Candidatus Hydrogenedentota bacterium]MBI3118051.1 hypothetical protein [Candidatus Hydrogenedentota bacterium]